MAGLMPAGDGLDHYRAKRAPDRTPEPFAAGGSATGRLYVMQKHAARNLHYDLRLELDGVLKSWAVPKDPSYDQATKRAAFMVEDHPVEYAGFEGVIPKGNYGAGEVIVWDRGTWLPLEDPHAGLEKGKLLFELRGHRMRGRWTLVKVKRGENEWLLIKERDALEGAGRDAFTHDSILTGLTLEDLRSGRDPAAAVAARLREAGVPQRLLRAEDVEVMLAETKRQPFDDDGWVFELKYDGYRIVAGRDGDRLLLRSRNGNDLTARFPDVAEAVRALPYPHLVLDGEVVVHDEAGLPSFQRLQKRARLLREADVRRAALELPATYYVFDLAACAGFDTRGLPLLERKRFLREAVPSTGVIRYSDHIEARGTDLYDVAQQMQLEGIIGKRAAAPYRAGRSKDWIKVRASLTNDFVVIGLKSSKGAPGTFGSLHVAAYDGGRLVYAGSVGTGLTPKHVKALREQLQGREVARAAADGAPRARADIWYEPRAVVEVRYLEWTDAGQLRHPVFVRIRDDKPAEQCVRRGSDLRAEPEPRSDAATASAEVGATEAPAAASSGDARVVRFTNLDKVLWPEDGFTKADLIAYYRDIAPWLLPYLRDRPVVLTRFPDGIHGKSFYQKDAPGWAPEWLRTTTVYSEGSERELRYFVVDDVHALAYLANSAAIPLHVWSSRVGSLDRPDWTIIDLDPKEAPFSSVVAVAKAVHELCDDIGLPHYVKTSGSSGLHVLIPLGGQCTHEHARLIAELLSRRVVKRLPEHATMTRVIGKRGGRVYLDYLQNGHGKLLVAPFSVRPLPGAPVSMPLKWSDVNARLDIRKHTIRSAAKRMEQKGDPLLPLLTEVPDLLRALGRLTALDEETT
jgi:bifunctional non-homologous end joining protein LigD